MVFVYSGLIKLWDPQAFALQVHAYKILPVWGETAFAVILPVFEFSTGGWLVIGRGRRPALLAAIGMLAIFILALGSVLARGLDIDCGCFGAGAESPWVALGRDLVLLAMAVPLYAKLLKSSL